MHGESALADRISIVAEADLTRFVAHRPSSLYWIVQPNRVLGGWMGTARMVRPWYESQFGCGGGTNPIVDEERAQRIAHAIIGDDTVPIRITSISTWQVNREYATRYSEGRVFCMGDAVHRYPPNNGLGSNTSLQDAYNLAWKLALVVKGQAHPLLLASYDAERVPIGRQIVERANRSADEFEPLLEALGLRGSESESVPAAQQRERIRRAPAIKTYEFNAHGVR